MSKTYKKSICNINFTYLHRFITNLLQRNIILIILSMTLEEFHKSFKDFYSRFDKNSDLYLNREEFLTIIQ